MTLQHQGTEVCCKHQDSNPLQRWEVETLCEDEKSKSVAKVGTATFQYPEVVLAMIHDLPDLLH